MAPTISYRTFHVSQVSLVVCPNTRLCHLLERIPARYIYQRFSWPCLSFWYFGQGNFFYSHLTRSTGLFCSEWPLDLSWRSGEGDTLEDLNELVRLHQGHKQVQKGSSRLNFSWWFYRPIMLIWSCYPNPSYCHPQFYWLWSLSSCYLILLDHFLGYSNWMSGIG